MNVIHLREGEGSWQDFFIGMCIYISQKSKDRSTKLGAVIVGEDNSVLSTGFNGFPRGVDDSNEDYHKRPNKYYVTEHAERNAIFNAAYHGIKLSGATLYMPIEPTPCCDCSRAIIQSGIKRIVGVNVPFAGKGEHWKENLKYANQMLNEAGVLRYTLNKSDVLNINKFYGA